MHLLHHVWKKPGLDISVSGNYRPVSNILFLSKVIECVVAQLLYSYFTRNGLHDNLQSAYKTGASTETAILRIKTDIKTVLDDGDVVLLVLLDLSAAFDIIDHNLLNKQYAINWHGFADDTQLSSRLSVRNTTMRTHQVNIMEECIASVRMDDCKQTQMLVKLRWWWLLVPTTSAVWRIREVILTPRPWCRSGRYLINGSTSQLRGKVDVLQHQENAISPRKRVQRSSMQQSYPILTITMPFNLA